MPTTALQTAWQLLTTLDPQLLAIVARSLSVSALACALGCAAGLVCGSYLGVARFTGRGALLTVLHVRAKSYIKG